MSTPNAVRLARPVTDPSSEVTRIAEPRRPTPRPTVVRAGDRKPPIGRPRSAKRTARTSATTERLSMIHEQATLASAGVVADSGAREQHPSVNHPVERGHTSGVYPRETFDSTLVLPAASGRPSHAVTVLASPRQELAWSPAQVVFTVLAFAALRLAYVACAFGAARALGLLA